jgi:hypothetical protein
VQDDARRDLLVLWERLVAFNFGEPLRADQRQIFSEGWRKDLRGKLDQLLHTDQRSTERKRHEEPVVTSFRIWKLIPMPRRTRLLIVTLFSFTLAHAQVPKLSPATPPPDFKFDGSWSCLGTFQGGKLHRSHYEGKTILAGTWTELTEQDIEPATGFVAQYLIGYDPLKKIVVEFAASNFEAGISSSEEGWKGNELTLTSEVMHYPSVPYEQTRSVFHLIDAKTFSMDWQIAKNAADPKWITGDHLTCKSDG